MLTKVTSIVLLVGLLFLIGCEAHLHKVGQGAQGNAMMQQRQWYVLWGLVPINDVDTNGMAGGASDYDIKTERKAVDFIINIFTGIVSVYSRTVTVKK